jgi:2-keto-4-pentenoate hydratase/2-oxohepta-3-ene-1,7-dioic acid hydratase in catechol pathway
MDKIICVGKNYAEHARELGDAVPERPVLFIKPPSALLALQVSAETCARFPRDAGALHHECEVVFRLKRQGAAFVPGDFTLGLDMTLRDRQASLKKQGHPWETAKVFEHSAIVGPWIPAARYEEFREQPFRFELNGVLKQKGLIAQMTYGPQACIDYMAEFFPLHEGDLIFTGTPAGVGPVEAGQHGRLIWGEQSVGVHWEG